MNDILNRFVENMIDRTTGPLHFRIFLQPVMAIVFAAIDGVKDARNHRPPYFWSLVTNADHRVEMVKSGWKSIGKVFILAVILDTVYQFMVQRFIYLGEVIVVSFVLAILPYLLLRGVVTRLTPKT